MKNGKVGLVMGCALAVSLVGVACGVQDDLSTERDTAALYPLRSVIWSGAWSTIFHEVRIPVCWDMTGSATEKQWVRDIVASTWSAHGRITFTGWGACQSLVSPGIHISLSDVRPHTNGLGTQLDGKLAGMVLNFTFSNWSANCQSNRRFCIEAIAVHEFGHALGFAHEQHRSDTPSSCTAEHQGSNGDTLLGPWDAQSVMNYCEPSRTTLSDGDVRAVHHIYGARYPESNVRRAALDYGNGKLYFFFGPDYVRYDKTADRIDNGYPARIIDNWRGLPSTWADGFDAAIRWPVLVEGRRKLYFFRDAQYIRYDVDNDRADTGYPRAIAGNWNGVPADWTRFDAVADGGSGKVFIFRRDEYLRFDVALDRVDRGPVPIRGNWIPSGVSWPGSTTTVSSVMVDEALNYGNGRMFFFRDGYYMSYNLAANTMDPGIRTIIGNWYGVAF